MLLTRSILFLAVAGLAFAAPAPPQDYAATAYTGEPATPPFLAEKTGVPPTDTYSQLEPDTSESSAESLGDFEPQMWGWRNWRRSMYWSPYRMYGSPYRMYRSPFYNYFYGGPMMMPGGFIPFSEPNDAFAQSVPDKQHDLAPQSMESSHAGPLMKRDVQDFQVQEVPSDDPYAFKKRDLTEVEAQQGLTPGISSKRTVVITRKFVKPYTPQPYMPQPYMPQPYMPQPYMPQPYMPQPYMPQPYMPQPYFPQPYVPSGEMCRGPNRYANWEYCSKFYGPGRERDFYQKTTVRTGRNV
ncbi:hypothetical protein BC936DRAFT_143588 [Jimgerdemannia flammicorona]|uniref:Uncharacterized protein n=1 Tax=Jimgerdemannia flammicorona TaxID=994334 RepID=A0A432ZZ19_9FUNG|nr:hypothetical protein BC936DRAFT_143588 [Jimgerdemannia flammicorona]